MSALLALDRSVVLSWHQAVEASSILRFFVTGFGVYAVYAIPLIWLVVWFVSGQRQRELLLSSIFTGALAWHGVNRLVKLFISRDRPLEGLGFKEVLFQRPENSFPSDHAAFLSGIAFFLFLRSQKKSAWWVLVLAILVALSRIALALHYPGDILGGFATGFVTALLIHWLHPWLSDTVWPFLINVAKKLHLA